MAEELFNAIQSNSQIYVNDHLTPYSANILSTARRARMNKQIYSVSSRNGRIGVKKTQDSRIEYIACERELIDILDNTTETVINETNDNNQPPITDKRSRVTVNIGAKRKLSSNSTKRKTKHSSKKITI